MKNKIAVLILTVIFAFVGAFPISSAALQSALEVVSYRQDTPFEVNAKACILMDCATGTVLTGMNENEKLYPASVTKIMSLILICEAIENGLFSLQDEITCSASAAAKGGSQIWLESGEVMTVDDLLKAVVVYSANDACCLLGECVAGDEQSFCKLMNLKAEELGMENTNFENCTGLDDDTTEHKSTAYDIALMSRELLKHDLIKEYTTIWMDSLRNGETQLVNTNKLVRTYPGITGLKTGTTSKAGCCVSASAKRDSLELIAVVLGADNSKERFSTAQKLLDWGFANFEIYTPTADGLYPESIKVTHGVTNTAALTHTQTGAVLIQKGQSDKITAEIKIEEEISAPVQKGQSVGSVIFLSNGNEIAKSDIVINEEVEEMTMKNALLTLFFSLKAKEK